MTTRARGVLRRFAIFSTVGRTKYFILEPGHTQVLENGKGVQLTITVLDRTESVGGIVTRVVEERELDRGALVEVSLNYFAICADDASVYYFGEAVDTYKNGKIVNHDWPWRHGTAGATAGLMMPAVPSAGARYHPMSIYGLLGLHVRHADMRVSGWNASATETLGRGTEPGGKRLC